MAADDLIKRGLARSRNELMETALRRELASRERARIDAEFEAMAADSEYEQEFREIQAEFAAAGREALEAGGRGGKGAHRR